MSLRNAAEMLLMVAPNYTGFPNPIITKVRELEMGDFSRAAYPVMNWTSHMDDMLTEEVSSC